MNKIFGLIFILLFGTFNLKAKNDRPFSLYAYGGYPFTIFDVNTSNCYFGHLGLRAHLGKGIYLLGGGYLENFDRKFIANDPKTIEYHSKMYGADIGLMYEIDLGNRWHLGPAIMYKQAYFSIEGTKAFNARHYASKNVDKPFYQWNVMQYVNLLLQLRKPINDKWDFLAGANFTIFEGNYVDLYDVKYRFNDMYIGVHLGLNYHIGTLQAKGGYHKVKKKFRQIYCPKF